MRGGIPGPLLSNKHTNLTAICGQIFFVRTLKPIENLFYPWRMKNQTHQIRQGDSGLASLEALTGCHSLAVWGKTEDVSWASYIIDSP